MKVIFKNVYKIREDPPEIYVDVRSNINRGVFAESGTICSKVSSSGKGEQISEKGVSSLRLNGVPVRTRRECLGCYDWWRLLEKRA